MVKVLIFFAQMKYITDVFLDRAIIKNFQNIFSTSLNCLYNLICAHSSHRQAFSTQVMSPFSKSLTCVFYLKKAPTQVFFYEICKIFKNIYFEEHLFCEIRFSRFNCISRFKFEVGKSQVFCNSMYIKIFMFLWSHIFFPMLSSLKITEICFFKHFQLIDVKSIRCFSGLSLISIIL